MVLDLSLPIEETTIEVADLGVTVVGCFDDCSTEALRTRPCALASEQAHLGFSKTYQDAVPGLQDAYSFLVRERSW